MKRFIAYLLILFAITSCSIDDDGPDFYYEFMPVESVTMPETMIVNNTYEINMTYIRPNSCYIYSDIYYSYDDETIRTIAVICSVYDNNYGCEPLEYPEYDITYNFRPTQVGTYTFKYWQGEDENGEDQYMILEVLVEE